MLSLSKSFPLSSKFCRNIYYFLCQCPDFGYYKSLSFSDIFLVVIVVSFWKDLSTKSSPLKRYYSAFFGRPNFQLLKLWYYVWITCILGYFWFSICQLLGSLIEVLMFIPLLLLFFLLKYLSFKLKLFNYCQSTKIFRHILVNI